MNRRDFLKLSALFTGAAATLPFMRIEDEMQLSDVWLKMANQQALTSEEKDFLHRMGDETQQRNQFVAGNTTPAGNLAVNFPFAPFYSEVLQKDTDFIVVNIPQDYNHFIIVGSGRVSGTAYSSFIGCVFNLDQTEGNYKHIQEGAFSTTQINWQDLSVDRYFIGEFAGGLTAAGCSSSFFCVIPNYRSIFKKSGFSIISAEYDGTNISSGTIASFWNKTEAIQNIKIFPDGGTLIKAGSSISVYGLL